MGKCRYFIAFATRDGDWFRFGCTEYESPHPIRTLADIECVQREIEERSGFPTVVVINWRLFDSAPDEANTDG